MKCIINYFYGRLFGVLVYWGVCVFRLCECDGEDLRDAPARDQ